MHVLIIHVYIYIHLSPFSSANFWIKLNNYIMDEEQRKRRTRRTTLMDQLLEERSLNFPLPETIESGESDTTTISDDEDFECSDDEFLDGGGLQFGVDMSEEELDDYEFQEDIEEDDVDPDQLSYEELLALGEMIGVENKGLSEDEITKYLHPLTCHSTSNLLIDKCVICQVEFEQKEEVVSLQCRHLYHKDCIVQWLQINKACPICNNEISSFGFATEETKHVNK